MRNVCAIVAAAASSFIARKDWTLAFANVKQADAALIEFVTEIFVIWCPAERCNPVPLLPDALCDGVLGGDRQGRSEALVETDDVRGDVNEESVADSRSVLLEIIFK